MAIRGMAGVLWMAGAAVAVVVPAQPETGGRRPEITAADGIAAPMPTRGVVAAIAGLRFVAGLPCSP